ncbi:MAG: GIY-YIG nuclease family protein, partial [Caldilineaceae bacterium]|nr:GIY-YIG nuclease family protein [Caldilineaceae bacterium]
MTCGIYKIVNRTNNQYYLGSSVNIEKRYTQHISDLRGNRHHSLYLQRAYRK